VDAKVEIWEKEEGAEKICFVEEDPAVRQSVSGSDWPMFTISDSRGKCKEFIVLYQW